MERAIKPVFCNGTA